MAHLEHPDVVFIGGGIMSAHLGAMLQQLDPRLSLQGVDGVSNGLSGELKFGVF